MAIKNNHPFYLYVLYITLLKNDYFVTQQKILLLVWGGVFRYIYELVRLSTGAFKHLLLHHSFGDIIEQAKKRGGNQKYRVLRPNF